MKDGDGERGKVGMKCQRAQRGYGTEAHVVVVTVVQPLCCVHVCVCASESVG